MTPKQSSCDKQISKNIAKIKKLPLTAGLLRRFTNTFASRPISWAMTVVGVIVLLKITPIAKQL